MYQVKNIHTCEYHKRSFNKTSSKNVFRRWVYCQEKHKDGQQHYHLIVEYLKTTDIGSVTLLAKYMMLK